MISLAPPPHLPRPWRDHSQLPTFTSSRVTTSPFNHSQYFICVCVCVCVEEGVPLFVSLRQAFHSMDKASFQYLATHILKGNQVIVRGNSVSLVTSLINILKVSLSQKSLFCRLYLQDLVPEKCCQIVAFSRSYKESFVCNFLGLPSSAEVPKHVTSSDLHVVVEILPLGSSGGGRVGGVWAGLKLGEGEGRGREEGSPSGSYRLAVQSGSRGSEAKGKYICPSLTFFCVLGIMYYVMIVRVFPLFIRLPFFDSFCY